MDIRDRNSLDRHITGNYGEDQFRGGEVLEDYIKKLEEQYGQGVYATLCTRSYGDVYVFRFTENDKFILHQKADMFEEGL